MNSIQKDLLKLFFHRDAMRERIYPTRVAYLTLGVVALISVALILVGAHWFRESLGLTPLSSLAAPTPTPASPAASRGPAPTLQITRPLLAATASPTASGRTDRISAPTSVPSARCPITWKVRDVAKAGGGRVGLLEDKDQDVIAQVHRDFDEAMRWTHLPAGPWNLSEVDRYYTPAMAQQVRANLKLSLDRGEYVQVETSGGGITSMSFTSDGAGVTFMHAQYEPITQTVRDAATKSVKRTTVLNDLPYRWVGVAMLYDSQSCRWRIDQITYNVP